MIVPTPGSWIKTGRLELEKPIGPVRKPFELRPHLTDKPFKNDANFTELRRRMAEDKAARTLAREESNEQND